MLRDYCSQFIAVLLVWNVERIRKTEVASGATSDVPIRESPGASPFVSPQSCSSPPCNSQVLTPHHGTTRGSSGNLSG